jgi:hypothetical protein
MNSLKWKIEHAIDSFDNYTDSWQRIVDNNYSSTPGLSSLFFQKLIHHYADSRTIIATAFENDSIIAHLLLEQVSHAHWATFNPANAILGPAVFSKNCTNVNEILKTLLSQLPGHCLRVTLKKQDFTLHKWPDNNNEVKVIERNTTMSVNLNGTFEEYWLARNKKLRNNIKRYIKRLEQDGQNLSVEILSTFDEISNGVNEHGLLESKGWKGKRGTAIHPDSKDGAFYRDLFGAFTKHSTAYIYRLTLNQSIIASRMVVLYNDIMTSIKIAYDENLSKNAPGRVLLYFFLKDVFDKQQVKTIEFYTHANKDQVLWATDVKSMHHVTIYRNSLIRRFFDLAHGIKKAVSQTITLPLPLPFRHRAK